MTATKEEMIINYKNITEELNKIQGEIAELNMSIQNLTDDGKIFAHTRIQILNDRLIEKRIVRNDIALLGIETYGVEIINEF